MLENCLLALWCLVAHLFRYYYFITPDTNKNSHWSLLVMWEQDSSITVAMFVCEISSSLMKCSSAFDQINIVNLENGFLHFSWNSRTKLLKESILEYENWFFVFKSTRHQWQSGYVESLRRTNSDL